MNFIIYLKYGHPSYLRIIVIGGVALVYLIDSKSFAFNCVPKIRRITFNRNQKVSILQMETTNLNSF